MTSLSSREVCLYCSEGFPSPLPSPASLIGPEERVVSTSSETATSLRDNILKSNQDKEIVLKTSSPLSFSTNHVTLLSVQGMTCQSCVKLIQNTLPGQKGVVGVVVSLMHNEAFVEIDSAQTTPTDVAKAVYDMGFDADVKWTYPRPPSPPPPPPSPPPISPLSPPSSPPAILEPDIRIDTGGHVPVSSSSEPVKLVYMRIKGMSCNSCVSNITSALSSHVGVVSAHVSLSDEEATVEYYGSLVMVDDLKRVIEGLNSKFTVTDTPEGRVGGANLYNIREKIPERKKPKKVKRKLYMYMYSTCTWNFLIRNFCTRWGRIFGI